jgi:DNA-binding MarR family transcriptional regulator
MSSQVSITIHEVVSHFDSYADAYLRKHHNTTFSHFRLLATLAELGTSSVTELAECLVISKAAVSKRVPELVADGWLTTSGDPANARRVMLDLTPRAWELVQAAGGTLSAVFGEVLDAVPGLDQEQFHQQLLAINDLIVRKGQPQ